MSDVNTMAFEPLLNAYVGIKLVWYFGRGIHVPAYVDYLATDEGGYLHGFGSIDKQHIPEARENYWIASTHMCCYLGQYKYNGDWKQSLQEV